MRGIRAQRKSRNTERGAIQLLEEAFHLLRTTSPGNLFLFFLGTIPFAASLMYFLADMSRSSHATRDSVFSALFMAVAFFWMKFCHAKFSARLWAKITPGQMPTHSKWQEFRYFSALCLLQAFYFPVIILAALFLIPLGWVAAAWQNMVVLAFTQDHGKNALRGLLRQSLHHSHYQWAQNHSILIILGFVGLFTWINIISACMITATFAKSFFGVESFFTINPLSAILNSTFLSGTIIIAWVMISLMLKAVTVLRCFYAESKSTGADLLSRLVSCEQIREKESRRKRVRKTSAAAVIGILFLFNSAGSVAVAQEENAPSVGDQRSEELRESIAKTMEEKQYQWRLSRKQLSQESDEELGWLATKMNEIADSVEAKVKEAQKVLDELIEKVFSFEGDSSEKDPVGFEGLSELSPLVSVILVVLAIGLIAWLGVVVYKNYQGSEKVEGDEAEFSGPVDLESEDIVATQLPEDEWMRLAREQIAKGDSRLAIRALFLASLANLGERGLLKIARFKSNRDYHQELELRARRHNQLRDAFDENTGLFERAWYGLHQIGEDAVDRFIKNYEQISADEVAPDPNATP